VIALVFLTPAAFVNAEVIVIELGIAGQIAIAGAIPAVCVAWPSSKALDRFLDCA
jgi:hypothetical protein